MNHGGGVPVRRACEVYPEGHEPLTSVAPKAIIKCSHRYNIRKYKAKIKSTESGTTVRHVKF